MPQKTCPKCNASIHARKSTCDCGHVFYETKAKVEAKPKAEGAGPGRKQCGHCNEFVGVRCAKCPSCGTDFQSKKQGTPLAENPAIIGPVVTDKKVFKIIGGTGKTDLKICTVPAGKCPVELKEWSREGLLGWAGKVQEAESKKGYVLANEGLAYFARQFFNFWRDADKETLVKETFPIDNH